MKLNWCNGVEKSYMNLLHVKFNEIDLQHLFNTHKTVTKLKKSSAWFEYLNDQSMPDAFLASSFGKINPYLRCQF